MSASTKALRAELPLSHPSGLTDDEHLRRLRQPARLATLAETELMDAEPEEAFDRFTRLAAHVLRVPTALITLVDGERQFFKSALGLGEPLASERGTPLSHSFCQYAVTSREPLVVMDARQHPILKDHLATLELAIVAYAGVPLVASNEAVLGTLCVTDSEPRDWSPQDVATLRELAELTMTEIELRIRMKALRKLEQERARDQLLLRSILDCMEEAVVVTSPAGKVILTNAAAKRHSEVLARHSDGVPRGVFDLQGRALPFDAVPTARAMRGEDVRDQIVVLRHADGRESFQSVNASPLRDLGGAVSAAVSVARDVTLTRAAERAVARSEGILRSVLKHLPHCAVLMFDHDLRYLAADGEELLGSVGLSSQAMVGRTLSDVASPQGLAVTEPMYRAALAGETRNLEIPRDDRCYALTTTPVRDPDGAVAGGLALIYDVTPHKRLELAARQEAEQSRAVSMKDELTQLCNRRGFLDLASKQLAVAQGLQRPALLFFVDLNGMKQINDQLGHEAGDEALVEMAEVLRTIFRGSDVLARLGGDEFVALLLDAGESQTEHFAGRIQTEIEQRNAEANRRFALSASIGCASYDPAAPRSIDELLAQADALMYEQKRKRKAQRA